MELDKLNKIKYFFENINVNVGDKINIDFKINQENLSILNKKIKIQKINYLLRELNILDLEDISGQELPYRWYVHGVYSSSFTDIYYEISKYNHYLNLEEINKSELTDTINKANNVLNNIKEKYDVTSEEMFSNILEFITSIIYINNNFKGENLKEFLITSKPKFESSYNEYYSKFNSLNLF